MSELNFHVRHEVTPERAWDVLTAIVEGYPFDHIVQADRQISRLRQLGLLDKGKIRIHATDSGIKLHQIGQQRLEMAMDLMHYLHYTLWHKDKPLQNTLAWSYRSHCDMLMDRGECVLTDDLLNGMTAELNNLATETFGVDIAQTKKGAVSLSVNSLKGIHHWLRALTPTVIDGDTFACRYSCSPELLLLSIGSLFHSINAEPSIDLPLTAQNRDFLCRITLLSPEALDNQLDWMLPLYPTVIQAGTTTGAYGRHIRLLKQPSFDDLIQ